MGCIPSYSREINVDSDSKVTDNETKVFTEAQAVLGDSERVFAAIVDYKGCRELVRVAMSSPSKENEQKAFEGLLVAVDSISLFFEYSRTLDRLVTLLLGALASRARGDAAAVAANLANSPALLFQLARVLDFVQRFDQTRMMRPNLSNDFSYYRRLLGKFSKHPDVKVKDDEASGMALFTAEHIPMTSTIVKAARNFIESGTGSTETVTLTLSTLANSCMRQVKAKRVASAEGNWLLLRAMTGAIVLHDHVSSMAFSKRSGINVAECLTLLKSPQWQKTEVDPLLNAIRYSSPSFKDSPPWVQAMFE